MTNIEYAPLLKRSAAWIIDCIIISLPLAMVYAFLSVAYSGRTDLINNLEGRLELLQLKRVLLGIGVGIAWLYCTLFESSLYQATPGKRTFGLVVVNTKGNRIGFGQAALRSFVKYLISNIFGIGYLIALFTQKRQSLHDLLSGCLVISKSTKSISMYSDIGDEYENGDEIYYDTAQKEIEAGTMNSGLWAKAFQLDPTNEILRRAAYLKLRVSQLKIESLANQPPPIPLHIQFFKSNFAKRLKSLMPIWIIAAIILGIWALVYFDSYEWRSRNRRKAEKQAIAQQIIEKEKQKAAESEWTAIVKADYGGYVHVRYTVNGEARASLNHKKIAFREHTVKCFSSVDSPLESPSAALQGVENIRVYRGPYELQ